ncbi:gliolectin [Drosophila ficusphila]|uniref:gliolectin n=1 Tax=Drosophila ficusphila TaxID=30025 RepID=UPI0007E65422|nr:gliolectin [Drosophila ficusphila]
MANLCPLMFLPFRQVPSEPRPPPSATEKKRVSRNLFGSNPGDTDIDQLLAQEQCRLRRYVKERYGIDIQKEEHRDQEKDALRGMRYPTARAIPSTDAECHPKSSPVPGGAALTAPQISASAQLILQNRNGTRHGQKPYAAQPQGLKSIYRVRKANKGVLKSTSQNSYSNNNNNVDNGTSELEDKEQ